VPSTLQSYFQQIRPLSACDAEDGRIVGHMLLELVKRESKELARAIRTFANRTAMLRECGFRHIGVMLTHLLTADAHGGPVEDSDSAVRVLDPSSLTEKQANAMGNAIASIARRSHDEDHMPATPRSALRKVVQSHAVLRAMKLEHAWFVPMLEVVTGHMAAEARRSTMKRLLSIVSADVVQHNLASALSAGPRRSRLASTKVLSRSKSVLSVDPVDAASDADAAEVAGSFSSVVRLGDRCTALYCCMAVPPQWLMMPQCAVALRASCFQYYITRYRRCLRVPMRARSSTPCARRQPSYTR
jgi:hypothetical protein